MTQNWSDRLALIRRTLMAAPLYSLLDWINKIETRQIEKLKTRQAAARPVKRPAQVTCALDAKLRAQQD